MLDDHKKLQQIRDMLVRNILTGERPELDEMISMSDTYQKVWDDHDNGFRKATSDEDLINQIKTY